MATDIKLNAAHDIVIEDGDLALVSGGEEVAQSCKIKLLTVEAEWILDFLLGTPIFDKLLHIGTPVNEKISIIKNIIKGTEGVLDIVNFTFGFDPLTHEILIEHETDTVYGPILQRIIT